MGSRPSSRGRPRTPAPTRQPTIRAAGE
jgi:hypothetical protein